MVEGQIKKKKKKKLDIGLKYSEVQGFIHTMEA